MILSKDECELAELIGISLEEFARHKRDLQLDGLISSPELLLVRKLRSLSRALSPSQLGRIVLPFFPGKALALWSAE
jgi:hypothetical protein